MQANDDIPLVPDYILKKLILLYGFTEELKSKAKNNFDPLRGINGEEYYLINGEWINTFKDFYNYNQIINLLQKYNIHFQNYEQCKNSIGNTLNTIKSFFIRQKSDVFPNELKGKIPFTAAFENATTNNMHYYNNFYLVNYELNVELSNDKEDPIKPNYSYVNNLKSKFFISQNLYFIHGNNFEIGKLNSDGMFIPLFYIKIIDGNSEEEIKNIIKSGGIEKYSYMKKIDDKRQLSKYDNKGGLIFNIEKYKEGKIQEKKENIEGPKDNIKGKKNNMIGIQTSNNQDNFNNNYQNRQQENYSQSNETKLAVKDAKIDQLLKTEYHNQNQTPNQLNGNINININTLKHTNHQKLKFTENKRNT